MPLSQDQDPSALDDFPVQIEFVVDLALNLGVAALHAPTVREVIGQLEVLVLHDTMPMSIRRAGRELLKAIFDAIDSQKKIREPGGGR